MFKPVFCYVDDLIDGIYRLLLSEEHYPVNIGNGDEITILDFAQTIQSMTENRSEISFLNDDRSERDPQRRQPDITRAKEILGWEPKVNLTEGLLKTIPYFRTKLELV